MSKLQQNAFFIVKALCLGQAFLAIHVLMELLYVGSTRQFGRKSLSLRDPELPHQCLTNLPKLAMLIMAGNWN